MGHSNGMSTLVILYKVFCGQQNRVRARGHAWRTGETTTLLPRTRVLRAIFPPSPANLRAVVGQEFPRVRALQPADDLAQALHRGLGRERRVLTAHVGAHPA